MPLHPQQGLPPRSQEARDIAQADRLLIVAAAGLSISQDRPNNPYHNPSDFALHYPQLTKYGYRTAFDAMGLARDQSVPKGVKSAFTAKHFLNMRFRFPPTPGYTWLLDIANSFRQEDVFCWTSNVDGCFERAGFDRDRVYTSQGEMQHWQCADIQGCGHVWNCVEAMKDVDAASPEGILDDLNLATWSTCPKCGSKSTFPNLRGGDWFNHDPYATTAQRLVDWLDDCVARNLSVAVLEVGCGPNTPIVTSIPAAAFASALAASGGKAVYLRINPDPVTARYTQDPDVGVRYYRWRDSWTSLQPLAADVVALRSKDGDRLVEQRSTQHESVAQKANAQRATQWQKRYRDILLSLRTKR